MSHHKEKDKEPKKVNLDKDFKELPEKYIIELLKKEEPITNREKELLLLRQEELIEMIDKRIKEKGAIAVVGLGSIACGLPWGGTSVGWGFITVGSILTFIGNSSVKNTKKRGHKVYNWVMEYNAISEKLIQNGFDGQQDRLNKMLDKKIGDLRKEKVPVDEYLNKDVSEYNDDEE